MATSNPAEWSDEQLIEAYRDGQADLFAILIGRYRQELYRFLVRFVSDAAMAEDLFQEAFLQVHLSIDSFDTSRRFRPWLFTIASNKARDYLRRSGQRLMWSLSTSSQDDGESRSLIDLLTEDDLPLPTEVVEKQEIADLVRQTVQEMPEHLREILLLAYFHQFPYRQIAEMLEIPLGTVKSRLHASVATFSQLWKHRFRDQPEPA